MYLLQIILKRKITKAEKKFKKKKTETKFIKTAKPIHRPSMDRGKLVNSPFSSSEGTYGCRPKKNRTNKIHQKVMMLVQSYSL